MESHALASRAIAHGRHDVAPFVAASNVAGLAVVDPARSVAAHRARRLPRTPRAVRMAYRAGAMPSGEAAAVASR